MSNEEQYYKNLVDLLQTNGVEFRHFHHKPAFTYEELLQAQKETGFFGTEGKCMVLKVDDNYIVYVTIQGKKVNLNTVKGATGATKVRLATPQELKDVFGAEPGCAYPFGFDQEIDIFVDPIIYKQEWFLFSPVYPNQTIQAKGEQLKKAFDSLANKVTETSNFNQ